MIVSDEIIEMYVREKIIDIYYRQYDIISISFRHYLQFTQSGTDEYIFVKIEFSGNNFNITKSAYIDKDAMYRYKREILTNELLNND